MGYKFNFYFLIKQKDKTPKNTQTKRCISNFVIFDRAIELLGYVQIFIYTQKISKSNNFL